MHNKILRTKTSRLDTKSRKLKQNDYKNKFRSGSVNENDSGFFYDNRA